MKTIMNWCIMLYFVVLFAERVQSIVRSVSDKKVSIFGDGFNKYVYIISFISLIAFIILLVGFNRDFLGALFGGRNSVTDIKMLCITIGVILVSGMVHTEYTIAPVQFIAYGFLIVGMILATVMNASHDGSDVLMWMSLVYLIAFSMAIPVMYRSQIDSHVLFHILEAVTALILVAVFSYLAYLVFSGMAVNLFFFVPVIVTAVLDVIIIAMRYKEQVNGFVMVALIATVVLFIIGKITSLIMK